ncbi:MAG TPA: DUF5103 domain-containing protein [Bacteroidia bacterium]|nr:DUF5103 domain-containing protein [Bacteroidia bacterium]
MKIKTAFILLFVLCSATIAHAKHATDTIEYYTGNTIRYDDRAYIPTIATVILSVDPQTMLPPIMLLGSEEKLFLSFDDLESDFKSLWYTVVHCSAQWEPSNASVTDYIDGFPEQQISTYSFSRNTLQRYTHYEAQFPHDQFKLLLSGNYILKVYEDNDPEKLVLTRRFMVYENKVSLTGDVHASTIVADRNYKQEVDFTVTYTTNEITNPFQEIYPVILQNGRWDNAKVGLQPQFLMNQELRYDFEDVNVFKGGKEFRWFDTRTLRLNTERVESISKDSGEYNVTLLPDERRTFKRYMNNADINGKFLIRTQDNNDSDVESEYCWVHFFMPWDLPVSEGNMYVFGAMTDWQCTAKNKMTYNKERRGYEASLYLKQGYYNYEYVFLKDKETAADDYVAEGMNQETENDYWILIYFRKTGARTDELVAVKRLNSRLD